MHGGVTPNVLVSSGVYMAALENYAELLRRSGHIVMLIVIDGVEMNKHRMKAALHIFFCCLKKSEPISLDSLLLEDTVDMSGIQHSE